MLNEPLDQSKAKKLFAHAEDSSLAVFYNICSLLRQSQFMAWAPRPPRVLLPVRWSHFWFRLCLHSLEQQPVLHQGWLLTPLALDGPDLVVVLMLMMIIECPELHNPV